MFKWLSDLLSTVFKSDKIRSAGKSASPPSDGASPPELSSPDFFPPVIAGSVKLETDAADFLLALVSAGEVDHRYDPLPADADFLDFLDKKLTSVDFEIPVLPEAAIKLRTVLANPMSSAADFVAVLKGDPALSAELLKMANSVYYGYGSSVHDLQQAVVRVGFNQLQGLAVMVSLRSRFLVKRGIESEINWLTDLSYFTAQVCQQLAGYMDISPGEAFTRGLLHHIEFFVLLDICSQYMKMQKTDISRSAVIEAIRRAGPSVHDLIARQWGFETLELPDIETVDDDLELMHDGFDYVNLRQQLDLLQGELIRAWSGADTSFDVEGLESEEVKRVIKGVLSGESIRRTA